MAANVAYIRVELAALWEQYRVIRDALAGETAVKAKRELYLPIPNSHLAAKRDEKTLANYANYLRRANFVNFTRKTLRGLVGEVMQRDPKKELPTSAPFKAIDQNASGDGVSLDQTAKKSLQFTLAYSRGGLLVDYPTFENGASKEQIEEGEAYPTITVYSPMSIINWRHIQRGAKSVLSLVVIAEPFWFDDDGFEMKRGCQFKVLRLNELGNYVMEIWRENVPTVWSGEDIPKRKDFHQKDTFIPKGKDGQPLTEIPFIFTGSENNDSAPDNPNMYDIASINMAHYRNSADYEEAAFITGQPTLAISGLDEKWYKEIMGGEINFGSKGGIALPKEASCELLQAEEGTMLKEAMDNKERQMVALGAKLIEAKQVQKTATEADIDNVAANSVLAATVINVSAAITWCLKQCCIFTGDNPESIDYELNKNFSIAMLSPDQQRQVIEAWNKGAISYTEMRNALRNGGLATQDDEEAKAESDEHMAQQAAMLAKVTGPTNKPAATK